jgi:hypothetical protein
MYAIRWSDSAARTLFWTAAGVKCTPNISFGLVWVISDHGAIADVELNREIAVGELDHARIASAKWRPLPRCLMSRPLELAPRASISRLDFDSRQDPIAVRGGLLSVANLPIILVEFTKAAM